MTKGCEGQNFETIINDFNNEKNPSKAEKISYLESEMERLLGRMKEMRENGCNEEAVKSLAEAFGSKSFELFYLEKK